MVPAGNKAFVGQPYHKNNSSSSSNIFVYLQIIYFICLSLFFCDFLPWQSVYLATNVVINRYRTLRLTKISESIF